MSKLTKKELEFVSMLHAVLGKFLGTSAQEPDDDGDGDDGYPEVLDQYDHETIAELAKAMKLTSARKLAKMQPDAVLALFVGTTDEEIAEYIDDSGGDGDGDDGGEDEFDAIYDAVKEVETIGEIREAMVAMELVDEKEAAEVKSRKQAATKIAEESSLEAFQEALEADPDDGGEDDSEAIAELLGEAELEVGDLRNLVVELGILKAPAAKKMYSKKLVERICAEAEMDAVREALEDDGGDDEAEEKAEVLKELSIAALRDLAEAFGIEERKTLDKQRSKPKLIALFDEVPLEEIREQLDDDGDDDAEAAEAINALLKKRLKGKDDVASLLGQVAVATGVFKKSQLRGKKNGEIARKISEEAELKAVQEALDEIDEASKPKRSGGKASKPATGKRRGGKKVEDDDPDDSYWG